MKKKTTEQRLCEASLKLISEKGYLGATTREIAQQAAVTELTLFRHFGSKEKLFHEVLSRYSFLPTLKELLPKLEALPLHEALNLVAHNFLQTLKQRKPLVKILYTEVSSYPDKIRRVYSRMIADARTTLAGYFAAQQKRGTMRIVSPEIAARMFLGMIVQYFRTEEIMKKTSRPFDRMEKDLRELVDIFIHGTTSNNNR